MSFVKRMFETSSAGRPKKESELDAFTQPSRDPGLVDFTCGYSQDRLLRIIDGGWVGGSTALRLDR